MFIEYKHYEYSEVLLRVRVREKFSVCQDRRQEAEDPGAVSRWTVKVDEAVESL